MSDKPPVEDRPRSIVLASWALVAEAVFAVASGASVYLVGGQIKTEVLTAYLKNNTAYTPVSVANDVHNVQVSALVQALVVGLLTVAVAFPIRNGRNWARWIAIVLTAYLGLNRVSIVAAQAPGVYKIATALALVASASAIVLLLLRPSSDFFNAHRRGGPRPAGGLFSARPRTGTTAARTGRPRAAQAPQRPMFGPGKARATRAAVAEAEAAATAKAAKADLSKRPTSAKRSTKPGQVRPKSKSRNTRQGR